MKKRILSMALIVAMVVAMIPAALVNVIAAPYTGFYNGYDVYVSESELTLDGQKDAAYENSEMIINTSFNSGSKTPVGFETWAVVTATGIYVYGDVKDTTIDVDNNKTWAGSAGDKIQLYFQLANDTLVTEGEGDSATTKVTETKWAWGYFEFDYARDDVAKSWNFGYAGNGAVKKSAITDDGWSFEFFMPWANCASQITNTVTLETIHVWMGVQQNDYAGETGTTLQGLTYDNPNCGSYWSSGTYGSANADTAPSKPMVPLNLKTTGYTAPAKDITYKSFVTDKNVTLDGKLDDVYLASQKITSTQVSVGTYGETAGFNTYLIATNDGIYVFASIYDDTLDKAEAVADGLRAQDGDKFQIYLQLGNHAWSRWGYIDFDYVDGGRHLTTKQTLGYSADGIQQKAVIWEDNKGWDIEIYIPNSISADHPQLASSTYALKDVLCKVNFQALNETCTDWDEKGTCTARERYGLAYDIPETGTAWNGPGAKGTYFVPVDFSLNPITTPGMGAITYGSSVSIDGLKDNAYGDDSIAFYVNSNVSSSCSTHTEKASVKAWVAVSDAKVNVYAEITDPTATEGKGNDDFVMFTYFPLTGTSTYFGKGYLRDGHIHTTSRWAASATNPFLATNGFNVSGTSCGEAGARKYLGDNKWAIELAMDLPAAERALLAQGKEIEISVELQLDDKCGDAGTTTCNTTRTAYNWYWQPGSEAQNGYRKNCQRFTVSKNSTPANMAVETAITGANVALGESITVNYYANVPAHVDNATMKFTMNGKTAYVAGTRTSVTEFKFAFTGIAPQCMGDEINAELYIGDEVIATADPYSVVENIDNLDSDGYLETDEAYALAADLLAYGAAAQVYANYKTDALVNDGWEDWATVVDVVENEDKVVGDPLEDAKFTAAGVYHANTNKLYAKIAADDISKVKATINGKAATIETYLDGSYIIYSDDIKVTDFDAVYTFAITTEAGTQTLTYSVNAWCAAKYDAENEATAELAKALYAYGVSAEAYIAA